MRALLTAIALLCFHFSFTQIANNTSLSFSHSSGWHLHSIDLKVNTADTTQRIFYSTDGSVPDTNATPVPCHLHLSADNTPSPHLSNIKTSKYWKEPKTTPATFHVVTATAFKEGVGYTDTIRGVFMMNALGSTSYSFPVINLITHPDNLFGADSGIYCFGHHDNCLQHGDEWEREVHLQYFDEAGHLALEQTCGMRTVGAIVRTYPQKSLRLYARKEYGNKSFDYPFFGNNYLSKFFRLNLRSMAGEWTNFLFSDDLAMELCRDAQIDADYPRRRFVIVYINGEYWGIHSLREAYREHDIANKYGYDKDDIDLLENAYNAEAGTNTHYLHALDYLKTHNMQDSAAYAHAKTLFDVKNLCDYFVAEIAFANWDWGGNNTDYWHCNKPNTPWRWIVNDMDGAFKIVNQDNLNYISDFMRGYSPRHGDFDYEVVELLLPNKQFRSLLIGTFLKRLNGSYSPERTIPILNKMADELRPEVTAHVNRWNEPHSKPKWENSLQDVRDFLVARPNWLLQQLIENVGNPLTIIANPVQNRLQLELVSDAAQTVKFSLVDMQGHTFNLGTNPATEGANLFEFALPGLLPAGTYIVKAETNRQIFTNRVLIQ